MEGSAGENVQSKSRRVAELNKNIQTQVAADTWTKNKVLEELSLMS